MDEIVNLLHESNESSPVEENDITERLAAVAAGGCAKKYFGKPYTVQEIENLEEKERKKLYARYEAKLGHEMIKSLGSSVVSILIRAFDYGLNELNCEIDDESELQNDLEQDPFLSTALSSLLCEIYYKYGNYLAPVSAALIAVKHIKGKNVIDNIEDDGTRKGSNTDSGE